MLDQIHDIQARLWGGRRLRRAAMSGGLCICLLSNGVSLGQPSAGSTRDASTDSRQPATAPVTQPATTQKAPETIPELIEAANRAVAAQDLRRAEVMLRRVLQKNPTHQDAVVGLSRVLNLQGHKVAALDQLEQFIKTPQGLSYWPAYVLAGELYYDSGFLALAKARLRRAEDLNPADARIQANLARTYQALQRFDTALKHANRAVELDPNDIELQVVLAQINVAGHRFAEADQAARAALRLAEARYKTKLDDLRLLEALNEQLNFLRRILTRHVQAEPENTDVLLELARIIRRQSAIEDGLRHHMALRHVVKADALKPNDYEILLEKATLQRLVYSFKSALQTYKQVLALRPGDEDVQKWMEIMERRVKQFSSTQPADQATQQDASNPE